MNLIKVSNNEFLNIESIVSIQVFRYTNNKIHEIHCETQNGCRSIGKEYIESFISSLLEIDKNNIFQSHLNQEPKSD